MAGGNESDKTKSGSAVWDRLNQQSDLVGELARNQAALEANVAALAESVRTGFDGINANLNRVVERDSRPTNWLGVGSLFLVFFGAMITFVALQTDPVRMRAMENAATLDQSLTRELHNAEHRGRMRAEIDALRDELQKVDQYGSRRWIQEEPKKD